jgi:hypothetical protein
MDKVFSDSESEFWQDLEKQVDLQQDKPGVLKTSEERSLEEKVKDFVETVPVIFYRDQMNLIISQMRIASDMQLETRLISSTKALTKKHEEEVKKLKSLHSEQISSLRLEFISLERLLKVKDLKISQLERLLIDQEQKVTYLRLDKGNKYSEEEKVKEIKEEMKYHRIGFDIQIQHMKELVSIYQKDAEKAEEALKDLEKVHQESLLLFAKAKSDLIQEITDTKDLCEIKIKSVQEKYEIFKQDVEKELKIRFLISKRQNDFIDQLKKELKVAKTVIETPRLNEKYLKRLARRGQSLSGVDEKPLVKAAGLKGQMSKKFSVLSSSFSTSASPMYSNASELELNFSQKFVGESKLH